MKHVGFWKGRGWGHIIEMVEVDGSIYALYGWNGEKYIDCWKCTDAWTVDPECKNTVFFAKPIYRFQDEGIDLEQLEENSDEWCNAVEIVDYDFIAKF